MNTQKTISSKIQSDSLSGKEKLALRRKRLRQKQVRRQKLLLVVLGAFFLTGIFIVSFFIRQKHPEQFSINSACESYRSHVESVSAQYEMSEYTDLILALMMQESSGRGPDVLSPLKAPITKNIRRFPMEYRIQIIPLHVEYRN